MITDEMIAYESGSSRENVSWERWINDAEHILGHDLDGDQEIDGYSLDYAHDAFNAGMLVADYARMVEVTKASRVAAVRSVQVDIDDVRDIMHPDGPKS